MSNIIYLSEYMDLDSLQFERVILAGLSEQKIDLTDEQLDKVVKYAAELRSEFVQAAKQSSFSLTMDVSLPEEETKKITDQLRESVNAANLKRDAFTTKLMHDLVVFKIIELQSANN